MRDEDVVGQLHQNQQLNFVQRVLQPDRWPAIQHGDWQMTHLMGYSGPDEVGQHIVYPHVVWDPAGQQLRQLDPQQAYRYARSTGEYIPFPSEQQAAYFSRRYKLGWGKGLRQ